jgi:hypothetical protein
MENEKNNNPQSCNIDVVMWRCLYPLSTMLREEIFVVGKTYARVGNERFCLVDDNGKTWDVTSHKKDFIAT